MTFIPKAFVRIAKEIEEHQFKGGMIEYGMKDGMVEVVYNPVLVSKIPADVMAKAKDAEQQIKDGKIVLE